MISGISNDSSTMNMNYLFSPIYNEYTWKLPTDYSRNEILLGNANLDPVPLPTFKDVIKVIIKDQYD